METTSHRPHKQPRTLAGEQQGRQHDLLHFKLQTEIRGDQTEHTYFEPSLVAHGRLMRRKEVWRRERILGQGSYGTVYRERLEGGLSRLRAVKQIRKGVVASEALEYTRELEAAVIFSRPKYSHCFARSNGWFENDQFVFIAMEYLELGDLQRYLNRPLPELETRAITSQVLEGLEYMHEKGFIHRDLKPGNLLVVSLAPNWHVKIADFGISKRQFDHGVSNTLEVGTFAFAAPEQLGLGESAGSYTCSVDMWSLGAVAYRILTGTNAFHGLSELVKYIGGKSPFPVGALQAQHMSVSGLDFVLRLMSPVPESRLSAVDADRHPWLAKPILSKETPVRKYGHKILPPLFFLSLPKSSFATLSVAFEKLDTHTGTVSTASAAWSENVSAKPFSTTVPKSLPAETLKAPSTIPKPMQGKPALNKGTMKPWKSSSYNSEGSFCFTCRFNVNTYKQMMLKCSHWICRGCITVKFINALLTFPVASPNCCDGYPIPLRHAYQVLDQGFWEVFRKSLPVDAKVTARSGKWRFYKMFGGLPQKSLDETSNDVYIGEDDAGAGAAPASVAAATYRSSPTELSSRESWEVPYRAIHYGVKGPSMPSNQRTKRPQNAVPDFDSWLQSVKPGPPPPREFFT